MIYASGCSVNRAPAFPNGPCDCGLELARDAAVHGRVAALITWARCFGALFEDVCREAFVEAHELPTYRLVMDAATAYLPHKHDPIAFFGPTDSMDFNDAREAVIAKL